MDFNGVLKNTERKIRSIYSEYKDKAKYINDIDSANKLMQLECKKINNYFYGVIEELSLNLSQEIADQFGIDKSENFRNINFFTEKVSQVKLTEEDMWETIVEAKSIVNASDKKDNTARNLVIAGGGATIGAASGWFIAEGTGLLIGGVIGLAAGITVAAIANNSNNQKENTRIVEKKVRKFNKNKLMSILEKREIESKKTIDNYVMNIKRKYDKFCEGC